MTESNKIDPATEELLTLEELAKKIQRTYGTVYRLVTKGSRSNSGVIVKLESIRTQSGMKTSDKAYLRFLKSLNS